MFFKFSETPFCLSPQSRPAPASRKNVEKMHNMGRLYIPQRKVPEHIKSCQVALALLLSHYK